MSLSCNRRINISKGPLPKNERKPEAARWRGFYNLDRAAGVAVSALALFASLPLFALRLFTENDSRVASQQAALTWHAASSPPPKPSFTPPPLQPATQLLIQTITLLLSLLPLPPPRSPPPSQSFLFLVASAARSCVRSSPVPVSLPSSAIPPFEISLPWTRSSIETPLFVSLTAPSPTFPLFPRLSFLSPLLEHVIASSAFHEDAKLPNMPFAIPSCSSSLGLIRFLTLRSRLS